MYGCETSFLRNSIDINSIGIGQSAFLFGYEKNYYVIIAAYAFIVIFLKLTLSEHSLRVKLIVFWDVTACSVLEEYAASVSTFRP